MLHIDIGGSDHAYKECLEMCETKHLQSRSDANTSEGILEDVKMWAQTIHSDKGVISKSTHTASVRPLSTTLLSSIFYS